MKQYCRYYAYCMYTIDDAVWCDKLDKIISLSSAKTTKEDYADENKYLIDLECGIWDCQKTIEKLCKENEQLKEYNTDLKQSLDWANERETEWSNRIEELKTDLEYAKAIIKDLLNNSHEYARQNAEDFLKGERK